MQRMRLVDDIETTFDDQDGELLAGYRWRPLRLKNSIYVHAWHGGLHIYMHRLILGAPKGRVVDHIDRDGLNNVRANLRLATRSENGANRVADGRVRGKTSKFKGVYWTKRSNGKWAACIHVGGKSRGLGYFEREEDAAAAYDAAAKAAWGDFARTNSASS